MRSRFDQFIKQLTSAAYRPGGAVETDAEVSPDARRIDLWFTPRPGDSERVLLPLGLLGRFGHTACTLKSFHQTPGGLEVIDCLFKHHLFRRLLAARDPPPPLPIRWILSAGRPEEALAGLLFRPSTEWGRGIYDAPPLMHTRLVVVAEIPATRDTLLVRLMGAGRTLARAIAELRALPPEAPERKLALPILLRLRLEGPLHPTEKTKDDQEFFMSTQDIVEIFLEQHCREARDEGRNEGRNEGRIEARNEARNEGLEAGLAEAVLEVYAERFGSPPAEVSTIVQQTHDPSVLRAWVKLVATATADDMLRAMRG